MANPSADPADDSLEARTARALRRARLAAGRSIEDVAEAAGLAPSTLSRLETGRRRLALDALDAICDALGTSPAALLRDAERAGVKLAAPAVRLADGTRGLLLAHERDGSRWLRLQIPAVAGVPARATHPGHDWVHVLRGRLRLHLGEEVHHLQPGESAHFDTDRPHGLAGDGGPCEVLWRVAPGAHAHHPDT